MTHQKDIGTEGWIPAFCCIFLISAALWPQTEPSGTPMRAHTSAGMGSLGMPTSARERQCQRCVQRGQAGRIRTRAHDTDVQRKRPEQGGKAARCTTARRRTMDERPASVRTYRHQQKAAHQTHHPGSRWVHISFALEGEHGGKKREANAETHLARVDALVLGLGALDGLRYHHAATLGDGDRPTPGLLHHSSRQKATAAVHHCHRAGHDFGWHLIKDVQNIFRFVFE